MNDLHQTFQGHQVSLIDGFVVYCSICSKSHILGLWTRIRIVWPWVKIKVKVSWRTTRPNSLQWKLVLQHLHYKLFSNNIISLQHLTFLKVNVLQWLFTNFKIYYPGIELQEKARIKYNIALFLKCPLRGSHLLSLNHMHKNAPLI